MKPSPSCLRFSFLFVSIALLAACGSEVATGSSSSSSGGGQGGTTSSSSGMPPPPLCQSGMVGLAGALGGQAIGLSQPRLNQRIKGSLAQFFFETQGRVVLFAESSLEMPGASSPATGLLRMPAEGPNAGEWFCAGPGTSVDLGTGSSKSFHLASLARLGVCPNAPVAGSIDGCFGGDLTFCPKGTGLVSTLQGAEFDWSNAVTGWGGMPGLYEIYLDNGGILALDIDLDTVLGGLLYIAEGSPDAGALYCVGSGFLQPGGQGAMKFSLSGLSRLGSCAEASSVMGELEGCSQ